MFCPKCGKKIEEGSKFCKYCGAEISQVGENKVEEEKKKEKLFVNSYNAPKMLPKEILKEGEKIIFEEHPNKVYSLIAPWIFGIILIIVGLVLWKYIGPFFGIIIELIGILSIIIPYIQWGHSIYAITTERVLRLKGVIGKDYYENSLDKIQDTRLKMGVLQRMYGCGDIMITTAGTSGVECIWKNINNPKAVQKTLREILGE